LNSRQLVHALEVNGVLMVSDRHLPSVVGMVGGPALRGSWWGHERGREIFSRLKTLETNPDALTTRLISGKVTYIHRKLWPDFLSIAISREGWQMEGLSQGGRRLLATVEARGELRMDSYQAKIASPRLREEAREIERRLLVYTEEIHTERGAHTKILMTWSRCPKIRDQRFSSRSPATAMGAFDRLVDDLNVKYEGKGRLPWRQKYTQPKHVVSHDGAHSGPRSQGSRLQPPRR
jgi:hypothetical protein